MSRSEPTPAELVAQKVRELLAAVDGLLVVGIDGRSGAGKSTLAAAVASELSVDAPASVTIIDGDSFYSGGSATTWDLRSASEKAASVIDWRRQQSVLEQLRSTGWAEWHPFDWTVEDWDREPVALAAEPITVEAGAVVVLDGAYSCRPELHDLIDLLVLLEVSPKVRRRQLLAREGASFRSDWEARWSSAEDYYFNEVMPRSRFDLVVG